MGDWLLVRIVKGISFLLGHMPLSWGLCIGRFVGRLCYILHARKWYAYANIRAAFPGKYTAHERCRIVRESYANLGQTFIELLRFPYLDAAYARTYFELSEGSVERIRGVLARGKGVVFLTAHLDNWELAGYYSAYCGYPLKVLVSEQKHSGLNDLLNSYREVCGNQVIGKGMPIREMMHALKENNLVAIVGDQAGRSTDLYLRFFGRLTTTHSGAFRIAHRNGSALLPCIMVRKPAGRHQVLILDEIPFGTSGKSENDMVQALRSYLDILEKYIAENPEQWMWAHKRWKFCKTKHVILLTDGKPGHEKQSKAVFTLLQEATKAHDHTIPVEFNLSEIPVRFKSRFHKNLFQVCAGGLLPFIRRHLSWLAFFLTAETVALLEKTHGDIIISCGSSVLPVALAAKQENMAKNVVIMRPSFPYNLFRHDCIIKHAHDTMQPLDNVVETFLAPTDITPELVKEKARVFALAHGLNRKQTYVCFLVGGETKGYSFDAALFRSQLRAVIAAAREAGCRILATNSRRTREDITALMAEELSASGRCDLCIDVNHENPPDAVYAMIGLSRVVFVSEESVSMTSEAIQSGRKVVLFRPSRDTIADKHRRFHTLLENKSLLECMDDTALPGQITRLLHASSDLASVRENTAAVMAALRCLL